MVTGSCPKGSKPKKEEIRREKGEQP